MTASGMRLLHGGGLTLSRKLGEKWPFHAALGALSVAIIGLFARLMTYPLRHDEQMYLPVGVLDPAGLYRDHGFNNMPNLPLLLNAVYTLTGTTHLLFVGRLAVFALWLLASASIGMIVWRATRSRVAAVIGVLLLITNPLLLGPAGMLVTNNLAPIALGLAGTFLFLAGSEPAVPRPMLVFASGICLGLAIGFKANAIFLIPPFALAALLVPRPRRFSRVVLPLLAGGIAGAVPVLAYLLGDPQGFLAHVFNYHRGPHIAYWTANAELDGRKVIDAADKLGFAARLWLTGATGLIFLGVAIAAWAATRRGSPSWPVLVGVGLLAGAMAVSFVPTPSFPQYYAPAIPFAIVLAALLYGSLSTARRVTCDPALAICALLAVLIGAPRPLLALPGLFRPLDWTGVRTHRAAEAIARHVQRTGSQDRLATLAPIYALEAGLPIYREFACGPLVYRVGDLIPAADRRHYRLVSPTTLGGVLDAAPPAAVLVGFEGELDRGLIHYAQQRGYRPVPLPGLRDRYGQGLLFVPPVRDRARPIRSS